MVAHSTGSERKDKGARRAGSRGVELGSFEGGKRDMLRFLNLKPIAGRTACSTIGSLGRSIYRARISQKYPPEKTSDMNQEASTSPEGRRWRILTVKGNGYIIYTQYKVVLTWPGAEKQTRPH